MLRIVQIVKLNSVFHTLRKTDGFAILLFQIITVGVILQIHLSFSQGGSSGGKQRKDKALKPKDVVQLPVQSEFITVFLKSIGVTVTEIQDVVFKYGSFSRFCLRKRCPVSFPLAVISMLQSLQTLFLTHGVKVSN